MVACLISTQGIWWHEARSIGGKKRVWGAIRICWHVQNTRRRRNEEEEEEERLGLLVWEWKVALLSLLEKIERKHFFFLNNAFKFEFLV